MLVERGEKWSLRKQGVLGLIDEGHCDEKSMRLTTNDIGDDSKGNLAQAEIGRHFLMFPSLWSPLLAQTFG